MQFGLQQREGEGWGELILPERRFFPVASHGRWLSSSPVQVPIAARAELAGGGAAPENDPGGFLRTFLDILAASFGVPGWLTNWLFTLLGGYLGLG